MTNPVSSFTVRVDFRNVTYDVEITPLMHGKPFVSLNPERIQQWNEAEKTAGLFSKKIKEMLDKAEIPIDFTSTLTAGSKDGFTFGDTTTTGHKTLDIWNEFIDCLEDPASNTEIDDEEDSVEKTGLGARLGFSPNVYLSSSPMEQQKVQFDVFKKKCREHFCQVHNIRPSIAITYDEFEKACLDELLYCDPSQDKMDVENEARKLWNMQNREEKKVWNKEFLRIEREIAGAAAHLEATAIAADDSDLSFNEL